MLGGARYAYGLAGEADPGTFAVDAKTQLAARQRLLLGLRAQTLALPAGVLSAMTPPAYDYARNREYFATRATPLFDPLAAADAAAALTLQLLLAPPRLQRLALQHARDPALPGVRDTIEELLAASWRQPIPADAGLAQVQRSVNWVVLDALLALLDGGELHASVDAELRAQLRSLAAWANGRGDIDADLVAAADRIARYLADPASVKLRALPTIPPGAPI